MPTQPHASEDITVVILRKLVCTDPIWLGFLRMVLIGLGFRTLQSHHGFQRPLEGAGTIGSYTLVCGCDVLDRGLYRL